MKTKLLGVYFFLIVLPLGFFTVFSYFKISEVILEQTFEAANKTFENTVYLAEETLEQLENTVDVLVKDPLIYDIAYLPPIHMSLTEQLKNVDLLEQSFAHFKHISDIYNMRLYIKNEAIYAQQNREIFNLNTISEEKWYKGMIENNHSSMWIASDDEDLFSLVRVIYNPIILADPLAVLRVDLNKGRLLEILSKTSITPNSSLILMDQNKLLLSSSQDQTEDFYEELYTALERAPKETWQAVTLCKQQVFFKYVPLATTGWYMISVMPYEDIFGTSHGLSKDLFFVVCLISIIAYALAYMISNSTLKRISALTHAIKKVQKGDLHTTLVAEGKDELGEMMQTFNDMVQRMNLLMEEKEKAGKQIKNLELKALQAQINPHFLYNSLDLVNCSAIEHNIPEITSMVSALAKFYKLSLSKGKDKITIAEELTHTKLYVKIQNLRFNNRITLQIEADEAILACKMIKIILQPIVENAIIHGIFEKPVRIGTIRIKVCDKGDIIHFMIQDDGIGMDEETLKKIFRGDGSLDAKHGYGIQNINERLQLSYGEVYRLVCESQVGLGTTVTFSIPKEETL